MKVFIVTKTDDFMDTVETVTVCSSMVAVERFVKDTYPEYTYDEYCGVWTSGGGLIDISAAAWEVRE